MMIYMGHNEIKEYKFRFHALPVRELFGRLSNEFRHLFSNVDILSEVEMEHF